MQSNKIKIIFLFLFTILIAVSGSIDWENNIGINYNLVIFYLLISLVFIFQVLQKKKIIFLPNNKTIKNIFFLFAITSLIITLFRDGIIITYFLFIVLTFILLIVFNQLLYNLKIKDALLIFMVAMFILMLINLYFHYLKTGTFNVLSGARTWDFRLSGVLGGGLAGALGGISAILPIILYLIGARKHKVFLTLNISLAWFILLLADNRTSMIACTFIYLLFFLYYSRKSIKAKILFFAIGIIIFLFIRFYLTSTTGGDFIEQDANYRELIWIFGIDQIFQSPLLGYGKQNPFASSNIAIEAIGQAKLGDPHNAFLFYILRNGIVVSFLFFWFIILFLVFAYKKARNSKYLILFSFPIYWFIIGITGGDYFNFSLNFSSVVFGISVFGMLNHPDIQKLTKIKSLPVNIK